MNIAMSPTSPAFVARRQNSGAEERANKDLFLTELCDVLEIPRPNPKAGDPSVPHGALGRSAAVTVIRARIVLADFATVPSFVPSK